MPQTCTHPLAEETERGSLSFFLLLPWVFTSYPTTISTKSMYGTHIYHTCRKKHALDPLPFALNLPPLSSILLMKVYHRPEANEH